MEWQRPLQKNIEETWFHRYCDALDYNRHCRSIYVTLWSLDTRTCLSISLEIYIEYVVKYYFDPYDFSFVPYCFLQNLDICICVSEGLHSQCFKNKINF